MYITKALKERIPLPRPSNSTIVDKCSYKNSVRKILDPVCDPDHLNLIINLFFVPFLSFPENFIQNLYIKKHTSTTDIIELPCIR